MEYKLIRRTNPHGRNRQRLYAVPEDDGTVAKSFLAKNTSAISSLSMGKRFDRDAFLFSFVSQGANDDADFNVGEINGAEFVFAPDARRRKTLNNIRCGLWRWEIL
jgi:hypothetical protein